MSLIVLLAEYWIRIKPQITPGNTECHCRFLLYHKDVAYVLHSNFRPFFLLEIRNWVCQYSGSPYTVSSFLGWSFCFPQDNFCPVALDVNKKRNKTKKKTYLRSCIFTDNVVQLFPLQTRQTGTLWHDSEQEEKYETLLFQGNTSTRQ